VLPDHPEIAGTAERKQAVVFVDEYVIVVVPPTMNCDGLAVIVAEGLGAGGSGAFVTKKVVDAELFPPGPLQLRETV